MAIRCDANIDKLCLLWERDIHHAISATEVPGVQWRNTYL